MNTLIRWWCQRCGKSNYFGHKVEIGSFEVTMTCGACSTLNKIRFNIMPELRSIEASYNREVVE